MSELKVGPLAIEMLRHFEGVRLKAYRDSVGVPTIGIGMTYYPDRRKVQMGDEITLEQAEQMKAELLERDFATPVRRMLVGAAETSAAQFGALVSFAYNVGVGALQSSTLLRLHKAGDYAGAANQFLRWNRAGTKVLAGLTRRRQAERALYLRDWDALAHFTNGEVRA